MSGQAGAGGGADEACTQQPLLPRRIVRLASSQIMNSVRALLGPEFAPDIDYGVAPNARRFPPLAFEGRTFREEEFSLLDRLGRAAGEHVLAQFAGVTGCGAAPTDECGRGFLASFAEAAYRHPLADAELESVITVYADSRAAGGTVEEAVQHAVWAVIHSPYFLYRTEFGEGDATAPELPLAPYEMASQLAYFLTDAPPDEALLDAASRRELTTPEQIVSHARRLLDGPAARANLAAAMAAYFRLAMVPNVIVDPTSVPGLGATVELLQSILHEGELFFERTLFDAPLGDLLTSRRAYVNEPIATNIYGVPPPAELDADGFGLVELPPERAGILTSAPFLTTMARPHETSVVERGLAVYGRVLCQMMPPFPEDDPGLADAIAMQEGWSEREKADFRADHEQCRGCHAEFDAYGLSLDAFDAVGRLRATDLQGRPIDPAVVLPELLDNVRVANAAEMAAAIASSKVFTACLAMNFAEFALADLSQGSARAPLPYSPASSCAVRGIVDAFEAGGDPSFPALITELTRARLLRLRSGDVP